MSLPALRTTKFATTPRRVFWRSLTANAPAVAAACVLDAMFLVLSVAFSSLLALYFGFDVFDVSGHPVIAALLSDRDTLALAALFTAIVLLMARVLSTLLDAHVVFDRELWMARRLRDTGIAGAPLSAKTVPRASNHFGRLSLASMNAASAVIALLGSALVLPFVLPAAWALTLLALTVFCVGLCAVAFVGLSRRMQEAMLYMVENAGIVSRWKLTPAEDDPEELDRYSRAYRTRIFLSSIFSYAPALLAIVFSIGLLAANRVGTGIDLGQVFVAFMLAQAYLGLVGRMFNSAIKASAFAPAVAIHADALFGETSPSDGPPASSAEAAAAERERELLALED